MSTDQLKFEISNQIIAAVWAGQDQDEYGINANVAKQAQKLAQDLIWTSQHPLIHNPGWNLTVEDIARQATGFLVKKIEKDPKFIDKIDQEFLDRFMFRLENVNDVLRKDQTKIQTKQFQAGLPLTAQSDQSAKPSAP